MTETLLILKSHFCFYKRTYLLHVPVFKNQLFINFNNNYYYAHVCKFKFKIYPRDICVYCYCQTLMLLKLK